MAATAGGDARPGGSAEALLRAALALFAARSYASVTIREIAAAAGVNTALIYYYYRSKQGLLLAALDYASEAAFAHFRALGQRHQHPLDVVDDWLESHLALVEPIGQLVTIGLDHAGLRTELPAVDRAVRRFYEQEARMLEGCVADGVARGLLAPVDPRATALLISTCLDGVVVRLRIAPELDARELMAQVRALLHARLAPGAD